MLDEGKDPESSLSVFWMEARGSGLITACSEILLKVNGKKSRVKGAKIVFFFQLSRYISFLSAIANRNCTSTHYN